MATNNADFKVKKGLIVSEGITLGGHTFNDIDIGSEHVDADDHIMSSGAIKEYVAANAGDVSVGTHAGNNNLAFFSNTGEISNSNNASFTSATGAVDFFGSVEAGNVKIGTNTNKNTVETSSAQDLILRTNGGTDSGTVTLTDGANGDINIAPNGTGSLLVNYSTSNNNYGTQVASNAENVVPFSSTNKTTATNSIQTTGHFTNAITSGSRTTGFGSQIEFRLGEINYAGYLAGKIGAKMKDTGNDNFDMFITPQGTGNLALGNFTLDADQSVGSGQDNYVMTYDHSAGTIGLEAASGASAIGDLSDAITTATQNVGIGSGALDSLTASSGNYNSALGVNALTAVSTGDYNVGIGREAGAALQTGSQNVFVGSQAGGNSGTDAAQNVIVGYQSAYSATSLSNSVTLGYEAGKFGMKSASNNIAIGHSAMKGSNADSTGANYNLAVGTESLEAITTGDNNTALGYKSMEATTTGDKNVMIGNYAGDSLSSGTENVGIGYEAHTGGSGFFNVSVGSQAGKLMTTNSYQTLVGYQAGQAFNGTNAKFNTAIGYQAMGGGTSSPHQNTALGAGALYNVNGVSRNNIGIGYQAGVNQTAGSGNIIIGSGIDVSSTTGSRQLKIAGNDGSTTTTWIEGNSDGIVLGALTPLFFERGGLNSTTVDMRVPTVQSSTANPNAYPMPFAGKVMAVSFLFAGGSITSNSNANTWRLRTNGAASGTDFSWSSDSLTETNTNNYTKVVTGSDVAMTFNAGDILQFKRTASGTSLNNAQAIVWVKYNL